MAGTEIAGFLEKKRRQGFTGCVKMVFEDGKLSLVTEANRLEIPRSKIFSQKAVFELLATTAEKGFCGTLVFFFNRGEMESYSFSRNYRGDSLDALMGKETKRGQKE